MDGSSIAAPAAAFVVGAAIILLAGSRLPVLGKTLASHVGLDDTAAGLFVLAIITSLPEFAVTLSAMKLGSADLALGNVLGSNNFNLTTAGFLCLVFGGRLLLRIDPRRYVRVGLLLVASTVVTAAGIVFGRSVGGGAAVFAFSLPVLVLFVLEFRTAGPLEPLGALETGPALHGQPTIWTLAAFVVLAGIVVAAGILVSLAARLIAAHEFTTAAGPLVLGDTFVGTLLVAVSTSLPEVTVAYSAVRRAGSPDMALGTLLGSNSFNLLVFALGAPLMLAWTTGRGSAWSNLAEAGGFAAAPWVSPNLVNAAVALVLTFLVLGALRSKRAVAAGVVLAVLSIPVYVLGLYAVFAMR
ncbi:MAG: hypothetical protein ABIG03_03390 [Candidatus Eisenbacteria bacterium]